MSKKRDDKLNHGPPGGDEPSFSLEEILAEFSSREKPPPSHDLHDTIPLPVIPYQGAPPPGSAKRDNVVQFPGKMPTPDGMEEPVEKNHPRVESLPQVESPPPEDEAEEEEPEAEPPQAPRSNRYQPKRMVPEESRELPFPQDTENPVAKKLNKLKQKADTYADHMFEEEGTEDSEEIRRAERYIPGVDVEEEEEDARPFFRERKPRRPPPAAPDLPPQTLYKRYTKGLKFLKLRATLVFLLAIPALFLTLAPAMGLPMPGQLSRHELQMVVLSGLLLGGILIGVDVWARGLLSIFTLRMGMDSLMSLSCAATLADALTLGKLGTRADQLPYCAAALLALACAMWGTYLKRRGQRAACRTAASSAEPYLVTLDDDKWNGREAYAKWYGAPIGFGRQMQADDGAQRIFHITSPLLFLACLLLSLLSSVGRERPQDLLWCLSATLASAASLSGLLCFSIPWDKLSARLSKSGAALAGWDGVTGAGSGCGILLLDMDLFPPGAVSMNGIKVFGEFAVEKVVGYAATLIRDSGSGLDKIFHDLLRAQGAIYRRSTDFFYHEGGGLCGTIRDQAVLVGSAPFMHLMRIGLPQGLNVKNAVFCAIDGELAGIFALNYTLQGAVEPALHSLIRNRVSPVLATRDFNIIPAMLHQRFKLPVERMEFPPVQRRMELADQRQEHSLILSAVLCREGLGPYAEAVVGAKRLRMAVRTSAVLASLGAAVGVLLSFYLTFSAAYLSLTPANLLVFLLMWLVPTPLIAGWVNRY